MLLPNSNSRSPWQPSTAVLLLFRVSVELAPLLRKTFVELSIPFLLPAPTEEGWAQMVISPAPIHVHPPHLRGEGQCFHLLTGTAITLELSSQTLSRRIAWQVSVSLNKAFKVAVSEELKDNKL